MNIIRQIIFALALCVLLATPAYAHHLKEGAPAPELVLHTLDGKHIATRDLAGKVVIVTFWATWCDICREELPMLSAYATAHQQQGLVVLGFSLDEPADLKEVKKVADTLSFPVGLLGSQYAGEYGRVWRLPVSFVIDRRGRLADNGWDDEQPVWTAERLKQVVEPLLVR
jgi:cytochrome c biogenesis protein CcmG/thiol:disulfide interchange protein DsbE